MSKPEVNLLFHQPILDHSFSADRQTLAVTRDNTVELYQRNGSRFTPVTTFEGHDKTVTSVDVAPNSGKIVTCSQDRNAYVWEPQPDGTYKRTLVLLRINRAATFVRWSPDEKKLAVGSGARAIAICYFEDENDWWVSRHIKKPIRSTVLSVAWHPNSVVLAAGSTDSYARVFSSFIKGVDARPAPTVWGERIPFATECGIFTNNAGGWVHTVGFSPSGDVLAYAAHDSSVTVVYPQPGAPETPRAKITIVTTGLPFTSLLWTREDELVAAGHDCTPVVFHGNEAGWSTAYSVDDPKSKAGAGEEETSALSMFKRLDIRGNADKDDSLLKTIHQNPITQIRPYEYSGDRVSKISSSGIDGRVVIFPLRA